MPNRPIKRGSALPEYTYRQSQKKEEAKIYKRLALFVVAGIVILVIIFFMGTAFLNVLGTLANGNKNDTSTKKTSNLPLQTPRIDKLPDSTNQEQISVTGATSADVDVTLTVNDKKISDTTSDSTGNFQFQNITLDLGLNLIKVDIKNSSNQTVEGTATITLDKTKPSLTVAAPVDGADLPSNTKNIVVSGTTEAQATIFVNNSQAVVDSSGKFNYNLPAIVGSNPIEVKATDEAGNVTTVSLTVTVEADQPSPGT